MGGAGRDPCQTLPGCLGKAGLSGRANRARGKLGKGSLHPWVTLRSPLVGSRSHGRGPGAPRVSRGPRSRGLCCWLSPGAPRSPPTGNGRSDLPAALQGCSSTPGVPRSLRLTQRGRSKRSASGPRSRGSFPGPARPSSTQARLSRRRPQRARAAAARVRPAAARGQHLREATAGAAASRAVVSPGTAPWRGRGVRRRVAEDEQPRAAVSPVTAEVDGDIRPAPGLVRIRRNRRRGGGPGRSGRARAGGGPVLPGLPAPRIWTGPRSAPSEGLAESTESFRVDACWGQQHSISKTWCMMRATVAHFCHLLPWG